MEMYFEEDLKLHKGIIKFFKNDVLILFYDFIKKNLYKSLKISTADNTGGTKGFLQHIKILTKL
jgi:DNA-binding FadR family transcriptional regulator